MRCLTVCSPFAELIVRGDKRIENRPRPTSQRGPLFIHAGLRNEWDGVTAPEWARRFRVPLGDLRPGSVIGVVDVVDCVAVDELARRYPTLAGDAHAFGPFCWILARPGRLAEPVPMSGKLGIYPPDAAAAPRLRPLTEDDGLLTIGGGRC